MAFALPDIPRSQFGGPVRQDCELTLPEDAGDRLEILNAPGLRLVPPSGSKPWEIATRAGISRLDSPSTLAELSQKDARTWRFGWTKDASKHSVRADELRDTVLKFPARDGRTLFALLRAVEPRDDRPLAIVTNQPLLFDRLEPRTRSVVWTRHPEALSGTKWKLIINRWRLVISRPDSDKEPTRRAFESISGESRKDPQVPGATSARDVIPGEVTLKLSIDPESLDTIIVRLVPDRDRATEGRKERAGRRKTLQEDTPKDGEGRDRDPIAYRRDKLRELETAGTKDEPAIKTIKEEIRGLKELDEIQQTEELLAKPARTELSVVIAMELDDSTILEIAKIGDFAD